MLGTRLTGEPVDLPATALLPYSTGNLKLGLYGTGKRAKFGMPHPDQELFDSQKPDLLTEYPYGDRFGAERKLRATAGILADVTFSRGKEGKGRPWGSTSAAIQAVQVTTARFLQAQALLGLGQKSKARALLADVLRRDPNHALASDLSCLTNAGP